LLAASSRFVESASIGTAEAVPSRRYIEAVSSRRHMG
jgi:hypothetical protein